MNTKPKGVQGFSIVELLTVMAIIAITATIAIPMGLNYIRNYEVTGAAQNVATQMQQARGQAVKRNTRRGLILNFNYPQVGEYQYTSLDENPMDGGWDGAIYPANPGVFDPSSRDYGTAPTPPSNTASPGGGLPSPHGNVISMPPGIRFVDGQTYTSLLFRVDGSVQAVNAANVGSSAVAQNGLNWEVRILHTEYGLSRTISISQNGRVQVTNP